MRYPSIETAHSHKEVGTKIHTVSSSAASLRGKRPLLEDSFGSAAWDGFELVAVADGFSKETGDGERTGCRVSKTVISNALALAALHYRPHADSAASTALFRDIDEGTKDEFSGSTLALAAVDREAGTVHMAALGDTFVFALMPDGLARYLPTDASDRLGDALWGCFGDRENRLWHSASPETLLIEAVPGMTVLVGSDGLFGSNDIGAIRARAATLLAMAGAGARALDLAEHAISKFGSVDNATAALMRFG